MENIQIGLISIQTQPETPGRIFGPLSRPRSQPKPSPVPLTGVRVTGDILGRSARIKVAQRFVNAERHPIEAVYRFPLPESAAVSSFKAQIDGRTITGQVEARDRAFEIYDDAISQGHGAFLMDEERPNIFTLSVGNLKPKTEALIEIEYVELLDMEGPKVRFALPTTISPRYIPADMEEKDGMPPYDQVHPEYGIDIPYGLTLSLNILQGGLLESVESPSHPISIDMKSDPVTVGLTSDSVRMDRDFILYLGLDKAFTGQAYRLSTEDGAFIQLDMLLTKEALDQTEAEALHPSQKEVVFLIDCSGSMQGDSIREARKALEICTRALDPGTLFNIVRFGSTFESLFEKPASYTEKSLGKALKYLKHMDADLGGTEVLRPISHILSDTPRSSNELQRTVILMTDGEVFNERQVMSLVRAHRRNTTLHAVGIGAGCNEFFIKGLARAGNGSFEFIYPGERIEPKVLRIFQKVSDSVITDAAITWPSGDVTEAPASPGLFLDTPLSVFARIEGQAKADTVTVTAKVNGQPQSWDFPIIDIKEASHPCALFWARERIRDLEEAGGAAHEPGSRQTRRKASRIQDQIIELSKQYGLLSQSTSYIAVEEREEKDKATGELKLRKVPVPITVGWHGLGGMMLAESDMLMAQSVTMKMKEAVLIEKLSSEMKASQKEMMSLHTASSIFERPVRRSAPVEMPPAPPEPTETDVVLAILATQKAGGGMEITPDLARFLEIDYVEFNKAAARLFVPDPDVDPHRLLSTAVLIRYLETRFSFLGSEWVKVIDKSRKWLKEITDHNEVKIGDEGLNSWVEAYLRP